MVRLKVKETGAKLVIAKTFQFHYGTIKSRNKVFPLREFIQFQFHYGTIKSGFTELCIRHQTDFNSTMVRLKVARKATRYVHQIFQFHYGTIKRNTLLKIQSN